MQPIEGRTEVRAQPAANAVSPGSVPDAAPMLDAGSKVLLWYGGAPALRGVQERLADRFVQVREGTPPPDDGLAAVGSSAEWNEPYDLVVLLASDQEQLDEWRQLAPEAWIVVAAVPVEGPEQARFEILFNLALEKKARPRVVHGSGFLSLLARLGSLEAEAPQPAAVADQEVGDARGGGGDNGVGRQTRAAEPPVVDTGRLRAIIECIYVRVGEALDDVSWTVTIGPSGEIISITISGTGIESLWRVLGACF